MRTIAPSYAGCVLVAILAGCARGNPPHRDSDVPPNLPFASHADRDEPARDRMGSLWSSVLTGDYWAYSRAAREIVAMDDRAFTPLAARLDDRRYECGQPVAVAQALIVQICRGLDVPTLHGLVAHEAPVVRFEAVRELERRGLSGSAGVLAGLAHDPDPRVRRAAFRARYVCLHTTDPP